MNKIKLTSIEAVINVTKTLGVANYAEYYGITKQAVYEILRVYNKEGIIKELHIKRMIQFISERKNDIYEICIPNFNNLSLDGVKPSNLRPLLEVLIELNLAEIYFDDISNLVKIYNDLINRGFSLKKSAKATTQLFFGDE